MFNNQNSMLPLMPRIFEDSNCLEETEEPKRIHKVSLGMKLSYHNRIQKKWIKRWGYVMKPVMYTNGNDYICHPVLVARLKRHLALQNQS